MFNFKFASDFLSSKTVIHSLLVTAGAAIAFATHQAALVPTLAFVAATWHVTWLRDTLQKLGEIDPSLTEDAPESPATAPVTAPATSPAAPAEPKA